MLDKDELLEDLLEKTVYQPSYNSKAIAYFITFGIRTGQVLFFDSVDYIRSLELYM